MYVYGACLFYVCCSDFVGVCGNVCCVAAVVLQISIWISEKPLYKPRHYYSSGKSIESSGYG